MDKNTRSKQELEMEAGVIESFFCGRVKCEVWMVIQRGTTQPNSIGRTTYFPWMPTDKFDYISKAYQFTLHTYIISLMLIGDHSV